MLTLPTGLRRDPSLGDGRFAFLGTNRRSTARGVDRPRPLMHERPTAPHGPAPTRSMSRRLYSSEKGGYLSVTRMNA